MVSTEESKEVRFRKALLNPLFIQKELNNRSFFEFFKYFWPEISNEELQLNWHIKYLCDELQMMAENVALSNPKEYDLIINIPPGTTKTSIVSQAFPVWCWSRWFWMKIISLSYSAELSLESADKSRDIIRSERFQEMYPTIRIKPDSDTKGHYKIIKLQQDNPGRQPKQIIGGGRYSTSVNGTLTGFHGHILLIDDAINPQQALSETELRKTNRWLDQTLSTRKINKAVAVSIYIMQRLHQDDPSGYILAKQKKNVKHICLPGESINYGQYIKPAELIQHYQDGLLDPTRLDHKVLEDLEADLGQYGYAGQVGQNPTPPSGGMFKIDHIGIMEHMVSQAMIEKRIRYWDKAGTAQVKDPRGNSAFTAGVLMYKLRTGKWLIVDVKRGRWSAEERERIILETAQADGKDVEVWTEQEPGSGGKESAEATIKNLAGFSAHKETPVGNKVARADPYSVQVNNGNVLMMRGEWNKDLLNEYKDFPFSKFKDQVDASSGAFSKLTAKRIAKSY